MKSCSNCFQTKSKSEFYRKLDGLQSRCKSCNAEVVRGYNQRRKAREIKERWAQLRVSTGKAGSVCIALILLCTGLVSHAQDPLICYYEGLSKYPNYRGQINYYELFVDGSPEICTDVIQSASIKYYRLWMKRQSKMTPQEIKNKKHFDLVGGGPYTHAQWLERHPVADSSPPDAGVGVAN